MTHDNLTISGKEFGSRLFLGTGKFASSFIMSSAVQASETELVTVALRRIDPSSESSDLLRTLRNLSVNLLPNTSGARDAREAVLAAQFAREIFETDWLKLEIHPNPHHLMPDGVETLKAAYELVELGFHVLPYVHADPVLCKQLEDVGVSAVMPLAAPIGTNAGLQAKVFLEIIIEQSLVPVVVDAGLGSPSDAARAMELGADAVLVNTAIATAGNPQKMADAFRLAVRAGREGFLSRLPKRTEVASSSSPQTEFLSSQEVSA